MQSIEPADPHWPRGLCDLKTPPSRLWIRGSWPSELPTLAIVGTRRATTDALDCAFRIARDLSRSGALVVSGGAYGIDAAAHEGALDGGGPTVAILGTPLSPPYPRDHAALFAKIAGRGAVVSEVALGGAVRAASFHQRNRLIAAVSHAVLVIQAPLSSGALSTAKSAAQLRRPLLACPWSPLEDAGTGSNALLFEGKARLVRDGRDVAAVMGVPFVPEVPVASIAHEGLAARVLAALSREPTHPDAIAGELGVSMSELQAALLGLVLAGDAEPMGSGYRRARR